MKLTLIIVTLTVLTAIVAILYLQFPAAEKAFQKDADVFRLRHLEYYGSLIEEYRDKTGKVPLQGNADVPIYVHIANDEQVAFTKNGPPQPHKVVSAAAFIATLEAGLGRPIDEFYDPQFRPYKKPNFYIYMVTGNTYFFAVHVSQPFQFAKRIGDAYHKIEISNSANAQNGACDPKLLFDSQEFKFARDQQVDKDRLFAEREKAYLHFTKQP